MTSPHSFARSARGRGFRWLCRLLFLGLTLTGLAFPPAPSHTVFGTVRDELGNPLPAGGAEILLEVGDTVLLRSSVTAVGVAGVNYRFAIPLDSGVTEDRYQPTALRPMVPFRLRVRVGTNTFLPIQMQGTENLLARPGASSRVDLTLGIDSDGDGLPDAWERSLLQTRGGGNLSDINPKDDADGDGLSNLQEYLAGTYAFDPKDGFSLTILAVQEGWAQLEFMAIRGHHYTVEGSSDLGTWTPVSFVVEAEGPLAQERAAYEATDVRMTRVVVAPAEAGIEPPRFFRLMVR